MQLSAASDSSEPRNPLDPPTLAHLLEQANSALSRVVDRARPPLDLALSTAHSSALDLYHALDKSDNPAAQALVRTLAHPRVQDTYTRVTTLASDQAPLLISLLGLSVHLYLAHRTTQRTHARLERQIADHQQQATTMSDYGLGDPSGAATGAAAGGSSARSRDDHGLVEVQWGREKLRVPLPPPSSPLSTLRATLYNLTGVPPSHQKLIYSGAVLKDDLASLSAYGLTDDEPSSSSSANATDGAKKSFWESWSFAGRGAATKGRKLKKLVMLGSKDVSARVDDRLAQRKDLTDLAAADAAAVGAGVGAGAGAGGAGAGQGKEAESEEAMRARIRDVAGQKLDELEPQVRQVEEWLSQAQAQAQASASSAATATADPSSPAADAPAPPSRTLLFLSEVLLQGLLKLDAFEIPSQYADARKERKDAVKRVQATLDRVDAAKEGWKKLGMSLKP